MKIMGEIDRIKLIILCLISSIGINAQVNQKNEKAVVNTILKKLKKDNIIYLLDNKFSYALVAAENADLIKRKRDIKYCGKNQILKINNQYIEDTTHHSWNEYSFENVKVIDRIGLKSFYENNKKLDYKLDILTIINPVFSQNKRKCLVNVTTKQSSSRGKSSLFFLKRKKGNWVIKKQYILLVG